MINHANIPNLDGKVAIVTGANSGTGYGISYHLAKHGCTVIMASRNEQKLRDARERLLEEVPGASLEIDVVDLASLDSIASFCDRIKDEYDRIDFLANNAGGGAGVGKATRTVDGLEMVMAINYLGHFALTTQLLPVLPDGSRVVTFSSIGYKRFLRNDLDTDNLMNFDPDDFSTMQEYCKAKLCCILFALRLQREFERTGSTSLSLSCHPGWARTGLGSQSGTVPARIFGWLMNNVSQVLGVSQSLYDGALPAIEALVTDSPQPDKVYSPSSKREATGAPIPLDIDRSHFEHEDIDKLWVVSQELVSVKASDYLA